MKALKDPTIVHLVPLLVNFLMRMSSIHQANLIGLRMYFLLAVVFAAIKKIMKGKVALSSLILLLESVNTVSFSIIIAKNVSTKSVIHLLIIGPKTIMFITNV